MTSVTGGKRLEEWMMTIARDGGIDRHDDLHIDQIDVSWRSREHWLQGGLSAYQLARHVRARLGIEATLALAFSLEAGEEPRGFSIGTPSDLLRALDWSPPSLYLFHHGAEPWRLTAPVTQPPPHYFCLTRLEAGAILGSLAPPMNCYALEFRSSALDEYSRSLFLSD